MLRNPHRQFLGQVRTSLTALLAVCLGCCSWVKGQDLGDVKIEKSGLIPAALGVRTDKQGNSWDIGPDGAIGRVGSTMVNHGLALEVNGVEFTSFQPLMTGDGKELVLFGHVIPALPGLEMQRRIRLEEQLGAVRYVEVFYNGSANPVTLDVSLKTNFSGNYQTFLSDRGRAEPLLLSEGESGIIVTPGPGQASRAFLFTLAEHASLMKPSISAQNRFGLTFQYRLELAPGETGALLHSAAQVVIPQNFDRPSLLKLFSASSFSSLLAREDGWAGFLKNGTSAALGSGRQGNDSGGVSSLGVERGVNDVLAIGDRTRLVGSAEAGDIQVKGGYGQASLPFSSVAAIVGKNGRSTQSPRIFLRDGQIFSAELIVPDLKFSQSGGGNLELDVATLDRLVMGDAESDVDWSEGAIGLIETHRGDRLRVTDLKTLRLEGVTPWGNLPIELDELAWLGPTTSGTAGYEVALINGTRCLVYLPETEHLIDLGHYGSFSLRSNSLRSIDTPNRSSGRSARGDGGLRGVVWASGNQKVVGDIGNTSLPLVSEGSLVETATSDVRRIERLEGAALSAGGMPEDAPLFELERWDGGVLTGFLRLEVLSMRVGGRNWQIPIADIERIETPWPLPDPKTMESIKNLIALLGSEDWSTREKATRDLGAFGYLAGPVLQRELAVAIDPEVSHRLERVLAELN
tara:strand:- start:1441 stop:3504 length:2064 start_codon:yes stop_codon:yes gene_type:complete